MKIRNGFVSNSSSSSFIVKGYLLDDSEYTPTKIMQMFGYLTPEIIDKATHNGEYEWEDVENEEFWDFEETQPNISFLRGSDDGVKDGYILIGEKIFDDDCADLPDMILSIEDNDITKKIKDTLELSDEEKLILACGTRTC